MRISDWSSDVCSSDLRVAQCLSGQRFQEVFKTSVRATAEPSAFGAYLRSAVLHSLAVRLKESFVQVGRGDERQVVMHVQLPIRSEEHTSELQSLMRISYAVFCLKKKKKKQQ